MLEALKRARDINYENERLASLYGGNHAFVKTYQDAIETYSIDKSEIEKVLVIIYENIKHVMDTESLIIQGRKNFADSIKQDVTKTLLKEKLYSKIKLFYDQMLNELYTNIQLFK